MPHVYRKTANETIYLIPQALDMFVYLRRYKLNCRDNTTSNVNKFGIISMVQDRVTVTLSHSQFPMLFTQQGSLQPLDQYAAV